MVLVELYSIRASITDASLSDDEVKEGRIKLDNLINIITNAPSAENNSNFPRPRLRR
jgi:hypothetical protein